VTALVLIAIVMGFSSDRIFACDLDSPAEGKAALAHLTRDAQPGSVEATPLRAFVEYVKSCASAADVKTKSTSLMQVR
jgi:hypothetical protein